ncbi:NADH:ubiquinone reductase (Na(+)-transporting) subunit B [Maioricimonas sp. JC845]|uniref:NADH:ubiquinone reductase (Na(+)-transporting) subunit B n=1 Tax=Maioricimonas sp. JC845 TaxID=3232138 RepID=UPI0034582902
MKPVRKFLDRIEPSFEQGGKLERFYPLYEALDTFLYTPRDVTQGPTHVRDAIDLKRLMGTVVVALLPCILMAMYNTGLQANLALQDLGQDGIEGWRGEIMTALGVGYNPSSILANFVHGALYFIPVYLVTQIAGGTCEVIFATIRRHEVNEGFLVTGMLYPLTLPPTIPLWMVAIGIIFGVVIGKEVFGGTGKNFLNPALTARAFLYFAYPTYMSGPLVWVAADGYTAPTSLGALANADVQTGMAAITEGLQISWAQAFLGTIPGSMGETSTLCCLIGAAILILTGIGSWRIMAAVVIGALGSSTLFWMASGQTDNAMFLLPPHWHLVVGGLAFGLVFMATDPVSAAMTDTGKWIYGVLIGVMTTLIRVINPGYAEGIMLAILFGNVFAPLIDYTVIQANIRRRLVRTAA